MADDLNFRIADRVRTLRKEKRLSLDALASKSTVSRSMLSLIERGESSPTAVVLDKIATAFGVSLTALFEIEKTQRESPLAKETDQPWWQDPASGYRRRPISPRGMPQPMQVVEVLFPPQKSVAFENGARGLRVHQQVWVIEGKIEVTVGDEHYLLREGDCLAMTLDKPTMFHNTSRKTARYAVITASEPVGLR